jgi:NDP-sugar pyrophosphorylase family protein
MDPASYLALNEWVIERAVGAEPAAGYVRRSDRVLCHETARISPDAVFVGPVIVGPHAQVMAGATVVGPTSIGDEAVLALRALVSRSAVWSRCSIGEDAVADRCILPEGCTLPPRARALSQVLDPGRVRTPLASTSRRSRSSLLNPFRGANPAVSK